MAILQSCCFWRSVRKGSYASAIFTAAYFVVIVAFMSVAVVEEQHFQLEEYEGWEGGGEEAGEKGGGRKEGGANKTAATTPRRPPITQSFLEPDGISETTMYFHVMFLACACCGFMASMLLCCGLYIDNRLLLIPWIMSVVITSILDLLYMLYLMVLASMNFNPLTAIVYTIDFFILSINMYCVLCVVSQYQEYKAGRGTAQYEDFTARLPVIRYEAPHGATSVMSSKKTTLPASSTAAVSPPGGHLSILLNAAHQETANGGGEQTLSPAAAAAEAAIAADLEARMALEGEMGGPSEGRITFVGGVVGEEEGAGVVKAAVEERWRPRKKRRPPKRVQFPLEETTAAVAAAASAGEGREEEAEPGHQGGPFILEGGHWSMSESMSKSAMLFLSSSSVTAAAAVVVANDTAPLLSPKPPLMDPAQPSSSSARSSFFGGNGSHAVDS